MLSFVTATMSRALDAEEEALVYRSLQALSAFGAPIFSAHGQSSPEFAARLGAIPHLELVSYDPGPGPLAQVRGSLQAAHAHGADWILYTEPDKGGFFEHRLDEVLAAARDAGDTEGIVMPSRTPESFATFPSEQQLTERHTNELFGEVLGLEADYVYGPFLMRRELAEALAGAPDDLGWGWRPFLMARAVRQGWKLVPLSLDLPCPESLRDERKLTYRLQQMSQNIRGLALGRKLPVG